MNDRGKSFEAGVPLFLEAKEMNELIRVSLGEKKADLVITGGDLVNVYSGEILPKQSVAVKGRWIAYVGPDASHTIGPETEIVEASGKILIPGFVDGHAHMTYYCAPDDFIRYAIKDGTTTVITETIELTYLLGYSGLIEWLDAIKNQPIKIFSTIPPTITFSEGTRKRAPSTGQLAELLKRDEIVGIGEGYWQEVVRKESNFPALSEESLRLRKTVEGHAAGCRTEKLAAYLAFGVSSCHESVNAEEALDKLRLGLWVMIREGSIRKELDEIARISDMDIDFRRLVLVTDGVDPRELTESGYMGPVVQRAIDLGFDPVVAIQMATLNPAEHFGLGRFIGGIAPGKCADIVIIPDIRTIKTEYVISNGTIIFENEELQVRPQKINLPQGDTGHIKVDPSDFFIRAGGDAPVNVRIIDLVTELVTKEAHVEMTPQNNELKADPDNDILKVSLINCEGRFFTGFIRGWGMKSGALATNQCWESVGISVIGTNEEDMSLAVNRLLKLGGGITLYVNGERQAELPLPLGGLMPDLPVEEAAERLKAIQEKAEQLGFRYTDAVLTLATLTSPAIPFFRISEDGLVDMKKGEVVGLIVQKSVKCLK